MINFFSRFVVPTDQLVEGQRVLGNVQTLADHIDHIVQVAGIDHVGIGSDFDGVPYLPKQMDDVSYYPYLTQELVNRDYTREQIHKILGGNVLRVLREAEKVAQQMQAESSDSDSSDD